MIYTYNHDDVYNVMIEKLETLNCWTKYNSYTSSNSIPTLAKPFVNETNSTKDYAAVRRSFVECVL